MLLCSEGEAVYQMVSQSQTGPNGKQAPTARHQRGRDSQVSDVEEDLQVNCHISGGHMGLSDSCDQTECFRKCPFTTA